MYVAFRLKSCPRCGGDLAKLQDHLGIRWSCLNCSRELHPQSFQPITGRPGPALIGGSHDRR